MLKKKELVVLSEKELEEEKKKLDELIERNRRLPLLF